MTWSIGASKQRSSDSLPRRRSQRSGRSQIHTRSVGVITPLLLAAGTYMSTVNSCSSATQQTNDSPLANISKEIMLVIQPQIQIFDEKTAVIPLTCLWKGGGNPPPTSSYSWSHNDNKLDTSAKPAKYSTRRSGSYLAIVGPRRHDEGAYKCKALRHDGHVIAESTAALVVKDVQPTKNRTKQMIKGSTGVLLCPVNKLLQGNPVFWQRNGNHLANGSKYRHTNGPVLEIRDVDWSDMGNYICTVISSTGAKNIKLFVSVQGPPFPPSNLTVQMSSRGIISCSNIKLSWKAPTFTGHSPLLGYELVCGTRVDWITANRTYLTLANTTKAVIPNAQADFQYRCLVRANNTLGYSTSTEIFFQCQSDAPSTNFSSTPLAPTSGNSWKYKIQSVAADFSSTPSVPTPAKSYRSTVGSSRSSSRSFNHTTEQAAYSNRPTERLDSSDDHSHLQTEMIYIVVGAVGAVVSIASLAAWIMNRPWRRTAILVQQNIEENRHEKKLLEKGFKQNFRQLQEQLQERLDATRDSDSLSVQT